MNLQFNKLSIQELCKLKKFQKKWIPHSTLLPISLFFWSSEDAAIAYFGSLVLLLGADESDENVERVLYVSALQTTSDVYALKELIESGEIQQYKLHAHINESLLPTVESLGLQAKEQLHLHEYILDTRLGRGLIGKRYEKMRYKINKFNNLYSTDLQVSFLSTLQNNDIEQILDLFNGWIDDTKQKHTDTYNLELSCFMRTFQPNAEEVLENYHHLMIRINGNLVNYASFQIVNKTFAVGLFTKSNLNITGINEFAVHTVSTFLADQGIDYINIQEDLDINGLRHYKLSLSPAYFAKTYAIEQAH